jgi:hypothetical protein
LTARCRGALELPSRKDPTAGSQAFPYKKIKEGNMSIQTAESVSLENQVMPHLENVRSVMARVARDDADLVVGKPRRYVDATRLFGFETMDRIDSVTICKMIQKVSLADLIMALTGSDKSIKEAVMSNFPGKLREISEITISKMENNLLPANVVLRCRDIISDAFLELMRE